MKQQSLQQYIGCTLSCVEKQLTQEKVPYQVEYATSDKSKNRDTFLVVQVKPMPNGVLKVVAGAFKLHI